MEATTMQVRVRGWDVMSSRTDEHDRLVISATPSVEGQTLCPACGGGDLAPKGATTGRLVDQPRTGRAAVIEVTRPRWQCGECGYGFSTPMPAAVAGGRFTSDAYGYALEQSAVVPLEILATTMGTPVSTLRRLVGEGAQPPAIDDVDDGGHAEELAICPLCVGRFDRTLAAIRSVPLDALPGGFRSRLPICPTCDEEGCSAALRR